MLMHSRYKRQQHLSIKVPSTRLTHKTNKHGSKNGLTKIACTLVHREDHELHRENQELHSLRPWL
jgi:hypothetical protein